MFGFNEALLSLISNMRNWDMEYMSVVAPAFNRTGDKSDGNFNPTSNTTLSKCMYQWDTVNIPSGVTVTAKVPGLLLLANSVSISGLLTASGLGAAGGAEQQNGANGGGYFGGGGGSGSNGESSTLSRKGGNGRGAGGAAVTTARTPGNPGNNDTDAFVDLFQALNSRVGGGGGASSFAAGGNGGGYIFIVANTVTINGAIRAEGLNGASIAMVGAGGGGGGAIVIDCVHYSQTGTVSVAGGMGGVPTNPSYSQYSGGDGGVGYMRIIKRRMA